MKALGGDYGERSRKIIDAGCDIVLHCNGDMAEMIAVADAVPDLAGEAQARCEEALKGWRPPAAGFDRDAAREEFRVLSGWHGV